MNVEAISFQSFFTRELARRKRMNPSYSLRAFARDLEIPAPKLSQILRGICGLSGKRAAKVAQLLSLSSRDAEFFILSVEAKHSRSPLLREQARVSLARLVSSGDYESLDLDRFSIIRDWFHFAILELTEVEGFCGNSQWIAERLGISVTEAGDAVNRLTDFGLLKGDPKKGLRQTQANLATPSGIPSRELREHHSQILRKAEASLEEVPVNERDVSEITMAIDSTRLPEAARWIREFRRKFCTDLQESSTRDRVYCLAIQFFPLDNKFRSKENP
jgi:uncharacterized protein (TIGR02147 family)